MGSSIPTAAHADSRIEVSPRLTFIYDSNIARGSAELARLRGIEQSDFRISPGLTINGDLPVGNQTIFLTGDAGYDFHLRNEVLNRFRVNLDGGTRFQFSRCNGTLAGSLAHRQSNLEDRFDIGRAKNTQFYRKIGFDARCGGPIGLSPLVGLSRSWNDNSADLLENTDSRSTDGKVGLAYARPAFGDLSLVLEGSRVRYPNRSEGSLFSQGYNLSSIGVRYNRSIGARIQGGAGLFRTTVDPLGGSSDKFTGITSNLNLNYQAPSGPTVEIFLDRGVSPAASGFGDYVLTNSYGLNGTYPLSARLLAAAGVDVVRRNTQGQDNPLLIGLDNERRRGVFGRLTYKRSERSSADFELRREMREADPSLFDYSSTRATLNLRLSL